MVPLFPIPFLPRSPRRIGPLVRFVVASSVSLAPTSMRELVHFAAPPLPEKAGDFSGTPLSRTSPGPYPIGRLFSFQGALCERALFANPMGSAKSPLTMFGQRGAKKEVVLRIFFYFFALLCRKPGGFNEALHLLSHWKGRL